MYSTTSTNICVANCHFSADSYYKERKQKFTSTHRLSKKSKRFSNISKLSQKHYYLAAKRRKMLTKRALYSKKKKWSHKKLFYLKQNQDLFEEKDQVKADNTESNKMIKVMNIEKKKRELLFDIPYRYLENEPTALSIKWFDSDNFTEVINRCIERNININGIEIFHVNENLMEVICQEEYNYDDNSSIPWFTIAFNKLSKDKIHPILYSATYSF